MSYLIRRVKEALRLQSKPPPQIQFQSSCEYWERRYMQGGDSGDGSYGKIARYKAKYINAIVAEHGIRSVIEWGCGDGNQLRYLNMPEYTGVDVSTAAISNLRKQYKHDKNKKFFSLGELKPLGEIGVFQLSMSLDVIYHLVEDKVYEEYMNNLFSSSEGHVIAYSSNFDGPQHVDHVKHRKFTDFIAANFPLWTCVHHGPNPFAERSHAEFFHYQLLSSSGTIE